MPAATSIPPELADLLTTDVVGHAAFVTPDGSLRIAVVWVDWDGEHVLKSSPAGSFNGRAWRHDPRIALSVVDHRDPWRSLAIGGRVIEIRPDVDLRFVNRLSLRYRGEPYPMTTPREIFVVSVDNVRGSQGWRRRTSSAAGHRPCEAERPRRVASPLGPASSPTGDGEPDIGARRWHSGEEDDRRQAVRGQRDPLIDAGIAGGRERDDRRHRRHGAVAYDQSLAIRDRVRAGERTRVEDEPLDGDMEPAVRVELGRAAREAPRGAAGVHAEERLADLARGLAGERGVEDLAARAARAGGARREDHQGHEGERDQEQA
jgi:hypothetical protein